MKSPPEKEKPGELASKTGRISKQLQTTYRVLNLLQAPFGFAFWRIERTKAQIYDEAANLENKQ